MSGGTADEYERRLERAAKLRAARTAGGADHEDTEALRSDEDDRQKREKIDDATRAEYLVRDAIARGQFENLKYAGKPIPGLGEGQDPDWWIKGLIKRENLTGLGPKAILLRTEDAELDGKLDTHFSDKQVREIVEDFNARVIDARRQLQGGPPVITKTRDVDREVVRWQERRVARAAAVPAGPEPVVKRPWWRRIWL